MQSFLSKIDAKVLYFNNVGLIKIQQSNLN